MAVTADPSSAPHIAMELLRAVALTLAKPKHEPAGRRHDRVEAAMQEIDAFKPRDAVEAMLAAQAVATNAAIMVSYHLAMEEAFDGEPARRQRSTATSLIRCMTELVRVIERRQLRELPLAEGALVMPEVALADIEPAVAEPERGEEPMHRETQDGDVAVDREEPMHREGGSGMTAKGGGPVWRSNDAVTASDDLGQARVAPGSRPSPG